VNLRVQPARRTGTGVSEGETRELARYLESAFSLGGEGRGIEIPLPDEPCAAWWAGREPELRAAGAWAVLERYVPRLWFPVGSGMSRHPEYRAATLRGVPRDGLREATGLPIEGPEAVAIQVYPSFAGRIPVVTVRHRPDFVRLVQALTRRNEPVPIPDAQGAAMVAGLPNLARIAELRRRWEERDPGDGKSATWAEEWASLVERKELYQDRFILLSDGPYSGVPAADLGLSESRWRELSLSIRREHECAHYFTRRAYGSMRNHLHDELIADYAGVVAAVGRFRAGWFLRFLGLEGSEDRGGGRRIELYRGQPPLSDGAFARLQQLVRAAAANLEAFDSVCWPEEDRTLARRARMVQALATLRLDELASPEAPALLEQALAATEEPVPRA
jgi:hypothetical protein